MANQNETLPEGTDSIVAGAARTSSEESLIVDENRGGSSARSKAVETLRSSSEKLSGQAADKARGFVGQGRLEADPTDPNATARPRGCRVTGGRGGTRWPGRKGGVRAGERGSTTAFVSAGTGSRRTRSGSVPGSIIRTSSR